MEIEEPFNEEEEMYAYDLPEYEYPSEEKYNNNQEDETLYTYKPYSFLYTPVLTSEEFDSTLNELDKMMDYFIGEENLLVMFRVEEVEKKKQKVINWWKDAFINNHLLYDIEYGSARLLLRHLFIHPFCEPEIILKCSTKHPWIYNITTVGQKTTLRISCEEMALNAKQLLMHFKKDPKIFTDREQYTNLLAEHGMNSTRRVDVCYVWYRGIIKCLSVLDRHDFSEIESIIANRELMSNHAKEYEKESKIKYSAERKNKTVQKELGNLVNASIKNFVDIIGYKSTMPREDSTDSFLVRRADNIGDRIGGVTASSNVIDETLKRLGSYTNDVIRKRGGSDAFAGDITLEIGEISRGTFDKGKKELWGKKIRKMMKNPIEKCFVKEHREQEIDINMLIVRFGGKEIARTIIPSTTYPHHTLLVNNGIHNSIIINNNFNLILPPESTKKRKRSVSTKQYQSTSNGDEDTTGTTLENKIKRIRLIREVENDPTLEIYRLTSNKLVNVPDPSEKRVCIVCNIAKVVSNFLKPQPNGSQQERNICYACLTAYGMLKKKKP